MKLRQTVRVDTYAEPEELATAIPGLQLRVTPLAKGAVSSRITTWFLDGILFQTGSCSPLFIEFAVGAGNAVLQVPLLNRRNLVLNGRLAADRAVGLYGGGAELLRANHLPSTYSTVVMPMQAAEALLCPPAGNALMRPGAHAMLTIPGDAWDRLAGVVGEIGGLAVDGDPAFATNGALAGLRATLLEVARQVLAHGRDGDKPRRVGTRAGWIRIVKGADAYLDAHPGHVIYTEELCAQLGISPASLTQAFRQVIGLTPHRFLKQRRLAMVRAALRQRQTSPQLIKTVALDHGFWHLGQFSADYRAMYGETPSETLALARA